MIFTLNLLTNIQHKPKVVNQNTHITCSLEQLFHERALKNRPEIWKTKIKTAQKITRMLIAPEEAP